MHHRFLFGSACGSPSFSADNSNWSNHLTNRCHFTNYLVYPLAIGFFTTFLGITIYLVVNFTNIVFQITLLYSITFIFLL
ncbi:hypothetical protein BDC45DRAFT_500384 [Circinella umbellata]|nr:hypothetical protein BDC45DRAFT_500384 [Circinella umbellata]